MICFPIWGSRFRICISVTSVLKLCQKLYVKLKCYCPSIPLCYLSFSELNLSKMWVEKSRLRSVFFFNDKRFSRFCTCPLGVDREQWDKLVIYWQQRDTKTKSEHMVIARGAIANVSHLGRGGKATIEAN